MFPFIIFLSGIWFFLKIKKSDELTAMKVSGLSNFSVIIIPGLLSILIGVFFITSINPITSVLVKKYETIKGNYERDLDYLAPITENGIWIKEKKMDENRILFADLDGTIIREDLSNLAFINCLKNYSNFV